MLNAVLGVAFGIVVGFAAAEFLDRNLHLYP